MLAGISLFFVFLMIVTVRLEELSADLHALREIGEQEFVDAYEEISDESSDSFDYQELILRKSHLVVIGKSV